jgi:hypothetical protein
MTREPVRRASWAVIVGCIALLLPRAGQAQARRSQPIEIRGQVPTPQVVTVRPRQVPVFSRDVLTPAFFDRHFWAALLAPLELAPDLSPEAGATATLMPLPADSGHRPPRADLSTRVMSPGTTPVSASSPGTLSAGHVPAAGSAGPSPKAPREK